MWMLSHLLPTQLPQGPHSIRKGMRSSDTMHCARRGDSSVRKQASQKYPPEARQVTSAMEKGPRPHSRGTTSLSWRRGHRLPTGAHALVSEDNQETSMATTIRDVMIRDLTGPHRNLRNLLGVKPEQCFHSVSPCRNFLEIYRLFIVLRKPSEKTQRQWLEVFCLLRCPQTPLTSHSNQQQEMLACQGEG